MFFTTSGLAQNSYWRQYYDHYSGSEMEMEARLDAFVADKKGAHSDDRVPLDYRETPKKRVLWRKSVDNAVATLRKHLRKGCLTNPFPAAEQQFLYGPGKKNKLTRGRKVIAYCFS